MLFSVEFLDFILYCVQQFGVMLAVGAATVVLVSYLTSMRDGQITTKEEHFAHAVERVLGLGIILIALSGAVITLVHLSIGESAVVFLPAFTFKWLLIAGLTVAYVLKGKKVFWSANLEGIVGATWYALFIIHIMAPIVSWGNIIALYVVWMLGFTLCWSTVVFLVTGQSPFPKKKIVPKISSAPKPVTPAPATIPKPIPPIVALAPKIQPQVAKVEVLIPKPPAPAATLPVVVPQMKIEAPHVAAPVVVSVPPPPPVPPQAVAVSTPAEDDAHTSPWLPAIHVMPKNQADLDAHNHVTPLVAVPKHA